MTGCILTLFLIDQMVDYEMPATEKLPAADEFAGMKASALVCGNEWSNSCRVAVPRSKPPNGLVWPAFRLPMFDRRPKGEVAAQNELENLTHSRPGETPHPCKKHPDATLKELLQAFGVSHHAIWVRLGQVSFTSKNSSNIASATRCSGGSSLANLKSLMAGPFFT